MYDGILNLPLWGYVLSALVLTHITIVSVTVFLHRNQAHRAIDLHPALRHFFRFWVWLTTGMGTREWVAVHRKHHAKCEGPEDPHSPMIFGIRKVLWQGTELYRVSARDPETTARYGHGTPDDWMEHHVYSGHSVIGIAMMLVIDLVLFGVAGITIWAVQMAWIPFFAAGVINGLGHYRGYRNYETSDASTNIVPWGILIGGEELHNNHHAYSSSAKFSAKWWEFDLGWAYIRAFQALGLARVKKVAPRPVVVPDKANLDRETVRAVITSHLHVLADYTHNVLIPVMKDELRRADDARKRLLRGARVALTRDETLLDESARERVAAALHRSQALATVYQFRRQLMEIWNRTAASHEHLVQALQDWCRRAEASGIESLQAFASRLRGYSLQPA